VSFYNHYPNRKDYRKPYRGSKRVDPTCRNGGSCSWCRGNRTYRNVKREMAALEELLNEGEDEIPGTIHGLATESALADCGPGSARGSSPPRGHQ
jgi:hypothetical protein